MRRLRHMLRVNPQLLGGGLVIGLLVVGCLFALVHRYDPITARGRLPESVGPGLVKPKNSALVWVNDSLRLLRFGKPTALDDGKSLVLVPPTGGERGKARGAYRLKLLDGKKLVWQGSLARGGSASPPELKLREGVGLGDRIRSLLGTDTSGQSILIQLVEGTSAFFLPGLLATIVALAGGILIGALAGFYGGWLAWCARYLSTVVSSFPNLILVLLCTTVFGQDMYLIAGVVGVTFIPLVGEEVRRKVAQFKAQEFVLAAEAHGLGNARILLYHILWLNCLPLILRQLVFLWGYLVILETSLSYLDRGVLHGGLSWGKMLYDYRSGMFRGDLWSPLVVTAAILIAMAGFYLLAEGLQRQAEGEGGVT